MPSISRELRALGIITNSISDTNPRVNRGENMAKESTTQPSIQSKPEVFHLNPCAGGMNPSSFEGGKLHTKTTK